MTPEVPKERREEREPGMVEQIMIMSGDINKRLADMRRYREDAKSQGHEHLMTREGTYDRLVCSVAGCGEAILVKHSLEDTNRLKRKS